MGVIINVQDLFEELSTLGCEPIQLKHCPICNRDLDIDAFGICRARKSGRNLYCKACIRDKVTAHRRALKDYRSARKQQLARQTEANRQAHSETTNVEVLVRTVRKLSPVERVREAIANGAATLREITLVTKLGKDEVGDALSNLLLWTREIGTAVKDDTRVYFIRQAETLGEERPFKPAEPFTSLLITSCGPRRARA